MAEINSMHNNIDNAQIQPPKTTEPRRTDFEPETNAQEIKEKAPERELDNVVSVSEHGDTVQVSDEGEERYEEATALNAAQTEADEPKSAAQILKEQAEVGSDMSAAKKLLEQDEAAKEMEDISGVQATDNKEEVEEQPSAAQILREQNEAAALAEEDNVQDAVEMRNRIEEEENFEAESTSFAGVTDGELEEMYLEGDISRDDYEKEVEEREAESEDRITGAEEMQEKENINTEEMLESVSEGEETKRAMGAVNTAFESDNETLSANTRVDITEAAQNTTRPGLSDEELEQRQLQDFQISIS